MEPEGEKRTLIYAEKTLLTFLPISIAPPLLLRPLLCQRGLPVHACSNLGSAASGCATCLCLNHCMCVLCICTFFSIAHMPAIYRRHFSPAKGRKGISTRLFIYLPVKEEEALVLPATIPKSERRQETFGRGDRGLHCFAGRVNTGENSACYSGRKEEKPLFMGWEGKNHLQKAKHLPMPPACSPAKQPPCLSGDKPIYMHSCFSMLRYLTLLPTICTSNLLMACLLACCMYACSRGSCPYSLPATDL